MKIILAIDPGASGGIAYNEPGTGMKALPMPQTEASVALVIAQVAALRLRHGVDCIAYMEQVGGYVKPGDDDDRENRQPGHTMFKFGRGVGVVVGALLSRGIVPIEVHPRVWQKPFLFAPKGTPQDERKRMLRDAAQRKFPALKVTLKTADALLLHAYASLREGAGAVEAPGKPASVPGKAAAATIREAAQTQHSGQPARSTGLFVADWKGTPTVFRQTGDESVEWVRAATADDLRTLPPNVRAFVV